MSPIHEEASERLRNVPPNWTLEHDGDLANFLCVHTEQENENLGSIKNYVEAIDVSTFAVSGRNPQIYELLSKQC